MENTQETSKLVLEATITEAWSSKCGDEENYAFKVQYGGKDPGTKRQWTQLCIPATREVNHIGSLLQPEHERPDLVGKSITVSIQ